MYTFRQVQEIQEDIDRLYIPLADSGLAANIFVPESRKAADTGRTSLPKH